MGGEAGEGGAALEGAAPAVGGGLVAALDAVAGVGEVEELPLLGQRQQRRRVKLTGVLQRLDEQPQAGERAPLGAQAFPAASSAASRFLLTVSSRLAMLSWASCPLVSPASW